MLFRILKSMTSLLVGIVIGVLLVVVLDIGGIRLKEVLATSALLEISNRTDSSVTVQVRDSVLLQGPRISANEHSRMFLPHIGLYEVSVSRPDGKVFAKRPIAVGESRRVHIIVEEEEIIERQ